MGIISLFKTTMIGYTISKTVKVMGGRELGDILMALVFCNIAVSATIWFIGLSTSAPVTAVVETGSFIVKGLTAIGRALTFQ